MKRENRIYFLCIVLFYVLLFFFSKDLPFFWDTILYSKISCWFIDNQFSSVVLPEHLDTGNQPFFSFYLAVLWSFFGKSLWISHLAVLPFLIGIAWQYFRLVKRYILNKFWPLALVFLALEPTLLAQSTMVSLDLPITFFFLLAINSILKSEKTFLTIAIIGLSLTNIRGVIAIIPLFIIPFYLNKNQEYKLRFYLAFLPGIFISLAWFIIHYLQTGWILSPSEWIEHREILGPKGIARNFLFIVQRFMDFGRAGIIIFVCLGIFYFSIPASRQLYREIKVILLFPLMVFILCFLPFSNPIGHRYFLVIFILLLILFVYQFQFIKRSLNRKLLLMIFSICWLSGHFFIYPTKYANGWDSFISHLPYFSLRDEMTAFIIKENIKPGEVAAGFPTNSSYKYTNLEENGIEFPNKYFGGIKKYPYVIYSNINNDFKLSEKEELKHWQLIKEYKNSPVFIRLYKNPESNLKY